MMSNTIIFLETWIKRHYLVLERKVRFLVGWVEPAFLCWVSLRSTQPTKTIVYPDKNPKRNPTNYSRMISAQLLINNKSRFEPNLLFLFYEFHGRIDFGKKIVPNGNTVPDDNFWIKTTGINCGCHWRLLAKKQGTAECSILLVDNFIQAHKVIGIVNSFEIFFLNAYGFDGIWYDRKNDNCLTFMKNNFSIRDYQRL